VRQRLPKIGIPLADPYPAVVLDLQPVVAYTYEVGAYRERLRYAKPCVPPLLADDQAWVNQVIKAAGTA
jgi:hypothetical protein